MAEAENKPRAMPRAMAKEWQQTFVQDCDQSSNSQAITISQVDNGGGEFWVIETERWAFDSVVELLDVLMRAGVPVEQVRG